MAGTATGVVPYNDPLKRKAWMTEGLVKAASKSFWAPYTGTSADAIVYQENNISAGNGHTVTFDFDGFLSSEGFRGLEQAFGKGETKRKFYDSLTVEMGRYSVDNGNKFDAIDINAVNLTEHADSRNKLSDKWVRAKDQMIFDAAQGFLDGSPSHIIRPNGRATIADLTSTDVLSYDFLLDLSEIVKSGRGFTVGKDRMPMLPYAMKENGDPIFLFVMDINMANQLRKDPEFQTVMGNADIRGDGNRLISTVIGKVGSFLLVEAPSFFGVSSSRQLFKTGVEIQGLRKVDQAGTFSGEKTALSGKVANRGLILGKSALMFGMGKEPDYRFQQSTDFQVKSESAFEVYCNVKKATLTASTEDYADAKVADYNFGCVAVDTYFKTI